MKKSLIAGALITSAIFGALIAGNAMAADMPTKAPLLMKAPPPSFSWTGCYIGGGGGYGMWNQETSEFHTDGTQDSISQTAGGRGWFGTGQVGCDYQVSSSWVIGAFGDWDFGRLKGATHITSDQTGDEKNSWTWAAGGRIGYVIMPQFMGFISGGYTQAHFDQFELFDEFLPSTDENLNFAEHTYNGWFLGTGYEYALNFLPGLFWKTEYRFSEFSSATLPKITTSTGLAAGETIQTQKFIQTIRSELVFRFNMFR